MQKLFPQVWVLWHYAKQSRSVNKRKITTRRGRVEKKNYPAVPLKQCVEERQSQEENTTEPSYATQRVIVRSSNSITIFTRVNAKGK